MFGAIATWNGVPPVAVQRHVAYLSTHEGALHEQHRASHRVDAASRRADAPPPAPEAAAPPPPPNPSTVPPPPPPPAGATPPMPGAPAPAAGIGQPGTLLDRFLARLIDGIIVGVVYFVIYIVLLSAMDYFLAVFLSGVVGSLLYIGYFAYMESNRGQTLGKQIMKLQTYGPDGASNPTMEQAVRRNIWYAFGHHSVRRRPGRAGRGHPHRDRHQRRPGQAPALVRQVRRRHHRGQGRLTRHKLTHYDADPAEGFCRVSAISETGQPSPTTVQTTIIASIAPPRTIAPIALPRL